MNDWLKRTMRLLLPRACPGCERPLQDEVGLCGVCRSSLKPRIESHSMLTEERVPHLLTLGRYRGPIRGAAKALKFSGASELAPILARELAVALPPDWGIGGILSVPLHPRRERERGYNQAGLLADALADALCLPHFSRALRRDRFTQRQASLGAGERKRNTAGAFSANVQGLPSVVLLVDDVYTTGQTFIACRDALARAGYSGRVRYAVLARAD